MSLTLSAAPSALPWGRAGMARAQERIDRAAGQIASAAVQTGSAAGLDAVPGALVEQQASVYAFKANLQAVRIQSDALGTLLDERG